MSKLVNAADAIAQNPVTVDKALFEAWTSYRYDFLPCSSQGKLMHAASAPIQATRITGQLSTFRICASTAGFSWRDMIAQSNPEASCGS